MHLSFYYYDYILNIKKNTKYNDLKFYIHRNIGLGNLISSIGTLASHRSKDDKSLVMSQQILYSSSCTLKSNFYRCRFSLGLPWIVAPSQIHSKMWLCKLIGAWMITTIISSEKCIQLQFYLTTICDILQISC